MEMENIAADLSKCIEILNEEVEQMAQVENCMDRIDANLASISNNLDKCLKSRIYSWSENE